jgi:HK97 family phage major capsid protein
MSQTLRRDFHPQIKVIDAKRGTVEYVASDESIDCSGEVVRAAGVDFSRFQKNAPFVNSHNYDSVENLLGKVVDYRVANRQVIETVQFAIDVPTCPLAKMAFDMTAAGYLTAVSIGFIPTSTVTRQDTTGTWDEAVKDLGLGDLEDSVERIYLKWLQLELSACCIGANANAVAIKSAHQAGVITDSDLLRFPAAMRAIESLQGLTHRTVSVPFPHLLKSKHSTPAPMNRKSFLDDLSAKISGATGLSTGTTDALEKSRRGQSESELFRSVGMARREMGAFRRRSTHEAIAQILGDGEAGRVKSRFLNGLLRTVGKVTPHGGTREENEARMMGHSEVMKSLTVASGTLGGSLLPIDVSKDIFDLVLINGAFRDLGFTPMSSMFTRFPQTTANPQALWIIPSNQGATITADIQLAGSSLTPEANSLGIVLPISRELLGDEKADLAHYFLGRFSEAMAAAIDWASFSGTGANDTTNGAQTGIFIDNTITAVAAAAGNTAVNELQHGDFITAVQAVTPAALQRPCRWFISPALIGTLMLLADSQAHGYLLKTPGESGDGEWYLCGFPVTWAAQAPSAVTPGSTIAAFGHGPSYMVAVRELLEVILSDSTGFANNIMSFRAICRAFCQTRKASGLATLQLAEV